MQSAAAAQNAAKHQCHDTWMTPDAIETVADVRVKVPGSLHMFVLT